MNVEQIVKEWDKDSKIDETELGAESAKIPQVHNKYLKIFMGERIALFKLKAESKKTRRIIKSINNRGFQIKSAVDWAKFTTG